MKKNITKRGVMRAAVSSVLVSSMVLGFVPNVPVVMDVHAGEVEVEYSISIDENITGGTVSVIDKEERDITSATAGTVIFPTIEAEPGYQLSTVTLIYNNDEIELSAEGGFSFEMPEADVKLSATFTALPAAEPTIVKEPTDKTVEYGYKDGNLFELEVEEDENYYYSYEWFVGEDESAESFISLYPSNHSYWDVVLGKNAGVVEYYYCVVTATRKDNHEKATTKSGVVSFSVEPKKADTATIWLSSLSVPYDGSEIEPEVTIKDGDTVIPADEYTVEYTDNVLPGVATVKVTDKEGGNYIVGKPTNNYEILSSFRIVNAEKPANAPSASQKVAYKNAVVNDVELPENWQWKESDRQLTLTEGKFVNATAEYVGEDAEYYKSTTVSVDISRLACDHSNTEIRNAKAPTTTEKGYTGDVYCLDCGKTVSVGQYKNKLPSGSGTEAKAEDSAKNVKYKNEWINGKWFNEVGVCDYEGTLSWKGDSTGWWVEDSAGWYPQSQWQKIDGKWYYFKSSGYMATGEYFNGYWFNSDGSMDDTYFLTWMSNSTGWWVEDKSGWWPSSQWLQIDGYWYYFNASGYMVTNQYVDGYWLGSDGACQ